jgi:membrane-bound metal-dependent hydrolase YbcI (DUF457 family)
LDNVTHTLFAVTLGRTPLGRAGRGTTAALIVASNLPDIDIVSTLHGGAGNYMHWHRGPTHGPLAIAGLGLITAAIVWAGYRWFDARRKPRAPDLDADARDGDEAQDLSRANSASFGMLFVISMLAIALHLLMDLPTSYGTRIFSPFDWHWYAFDWMPIIDVYLLIALATGLLFGMRSDAAKRRNAAIVLVIMAANYGVRAIAHHQALVLAPRLFGPTLPSRCADAPDTSSILDRWPRTLNPLPETRNSERRCLVEIAALPTFLSPFDWRIVAQISNAYEIHEMDVLDARFRVPASAGEVFWRQSVRYPNIWSPKVLQAAAAPLAQIFLGFSRFPAARAVTDDRGVTSVRFSDMRFAAGLIALEQPVRRATPFSVLVRVTRDGRVTEASLGR